MNKGASLYVFFSLLNYILNQISMTLQKLLTYENIILLVKTYFSFLSDTTYIPSQNTESIFWQNLCAMKNARDVFSIWILM